jgi:hypothetical protein
MTMVDYTMMSVLSTEINKQTKGPQQIRHAVIGVMALRPLHPWLTDLAQMLRAGLMLREQGMTGLTTRNMMIVRSAEMNMQTLGKWQMLHVVNVVAWMLRTGMMLLEAAMAMTVTGL